MSAIAEKYPSHKSVLIDSQLSHEDIADYRRFIGEETYSDSGEKVYMIGDEPTWCVDPLDGEFLH